MARLCLLFVMCVMSLVSGRRIHNPWEETDSEPASRSSRTLGVCPVTQPINCGRRPGFRTNDDGLDKILGGTAAQRGEIPWIARVHKLVWIQGRQYPSTLCAGVIVNQYWILTAALCTSSNTSLSSIRIVVGNVNLTVSEEGQQVLSVSGFYPHANFIGVETHNDYNIALYKIAPTSDGCGIRFNNFVQPICLPGASLRCPGLVMVLTAGWGSSIYRNEGLSPVLKKIQLEVEPFIVCKVFFDHYNYNTDVTERMFCVGGQHSNAGPCAADVGGPAVYKSQGRYVLIGIVSHRSLCSPEHTEVVMVNVPKYRDWVLDTINANSADAENVLPDDNITSSSATGA